MPESMTLPEMIATHRFQNRVPPTPSMARRTERVRCGLPDSTRHIAEMIAQMLSKTGVPSIKEDHDTS